MRRIFKSDDDGLLHEIKGDADAVLVPHSVAVIDVIILLSDAEVAQLAADRTEHEAKQAAAAAAAREKTQRRQVALAKFQALGVTAEDIDTLTS